MTSGVKGMVGPVPAMRLRRNHSTQHAEGRETMKPKWFLMVFGALLVAGFALVAAPQHAAAASCVATTNGNWGTAGTWSCGNVPVAGDTVTIQNGATVTLNVSNAVCASIQLGGTTPASGSGILAFNSGSQVTVSGAITFGNGSRTGSINMTSGGTLKAGSFTATNIGTWTQGSGTVAAPPPITPYRTILLLTLSTT